VEVVEAFGKYYRDGTDGSTYSTQVSSFVEPTIQLHDGDVFVFKFLSFNEVIDVVKLYTCSSKLIL
jgi:hypothetical protein